MKVHELKTWPRFYKAVLGNRKLFEVRRNDRGFEEGDVLVLREWDNGFGKYTGRKLRRLVLYLLEGGNGYLGIAPGFVVMGIGTWECPTCSAAVEPSEDCQECGGVGNGDEACDVCHQCRWVEPD